MAKLIMPMSLPKGDFTRITQTSICWVNTLGDYIKIHKANDV